MNETSLTLSGWQVHAVFYFCIKIKKPGKMEERAVCPECGSVIIGRTDKRFCSDGCRVTYNNRIYRERRSEVSPVNRILMKNYTILRSSFRAGEEVLPVTDMLRKGFDFSHITSILGRCEEYSSLWVCCYTYAYTVDTRGNVIIKAVPRKPDAEDDD